MKEEHIIMNGDCKHNQEDHHGPQKTQRDVKYEIRFYSPTVMEGQIMMKLQFMVVVGAMTDGGTKENVNVDVL